MTYKRDERFGAKISKAPAVEPCSNGIRVHKTILYNGDYACALCRWSLIDVTKPGEKQWFIHNYPIPMEAQNIQVEV